MSFDYSIAYHCHCSIELNSGVSITLKSLTQRMTYAGLLAGIPTSQLNHKLIQGVLENSGRTSGMTGNKPFLVQPRRRDFLRQPGDMDSSRSDGRTAEWLPMITCIGEFHSSAPASNPDMDASSLTIVWFQDEYAVPIAEVVMDSIKCIDWNSHADDFEC
jgi:hypothetical protein